MNINFNDLTDDDIEFLKYELDSKLKDEFVRSDIEYFLKLSKNDYLIYQKLLYKFNDHVFYHRNVKKPRGVQLKEVIDTIQNDSQNHSRLDLFFLLMNILINLILNHPLIL